MMSFRKTGVEYFCTNKKRTELCVEYNLMKEAHLWKSSSRKHKCIYSTRSCQNQQLLKCLNRVIEDED